MLSKLQERMVEALYGEEYPAFDSSISYKGAKRVANKAAADEIAAQATARESPLRKKNL